MWTRTNRRGYKENVVDKKHLKLKDLIEEAQHLGNRYLVKENIPSYPHPEFHVSHLKHDTDEAGLRGIKRDRGFKNPFEEGSLVWWNLVVGPDEIRSAEKRLLETTFEGWTEEEAQGQQSFLKKFATSPAFNKTSRLGSYRFTFPLEELLTAYSKQFCQGAPPVMRVLETVLYKQEVMYVVVVNSPDNQEKYSNCPLLTEDDPNAVCTYKDGRFIWRAEAMCGTHKYKLLERPIELQMEAQCGPDRDEYYVWDHVAVAMHVGNQVLNFYPSQLRDNLKFCSAQSYGKINPGPYDDFPKAEENVKGLWSVLEKDE